jgi:hypothetical protein
MASARVAGFVSMMPRRVYEYDERFQERVQDVIKAKGGL